MTEAEGLTLGDLIADDRSDGTADLDETLRAEQLAQGIQRLAERERCVVEDKLKGRSHLEIGAKLCLSRSRVGQLWGRVRRQLAAELEPQGVAV